MSRVALAPVVVRVEVRHDECGADALRAIALRRLCTACGWPTFASLAMCECDAPTVRAPSDEGALAAARAAEYEAHTLPLLEHLRGRRVPFHEVDVVDSLPEMDERVSAALQGQ